MIKAAAIQVQKDKEVKKNFKRIEKLIERAISKNSDIICLPEYFSMDSNFLKTLDENKEDTLSFLKDISQKYGIIILGNVLEEIEERYYNIAYIYEKGSLIGKQVKIHPTRGKEH